MVTFPEKFFRTLAASVLAACVLVGCGRAKTDSSKSGKADALADGVSKASLAEPFDEFSKMLGRGDFRKAAKYLADMSQSPDYAQMKSAYVAAVCKSANAALTNADCNVFKEAVARLAKFSESSVAELLKSAESRADSLAKEMRFLPAADFYRAVFEKRNGDFQTKRKYLSALAKRGDFKTAAATAKELLEKLPSDASIKEIYVDSLIGSASAAEAVEFARSYAASDKYSALPHRLLGRAAAKSGLRDLALSEYALAAYYGVSDFETVLEAGEYFLANADVEKFNVMTSAISSLDESASSVRIVAAYLMAKASERDGNRNHNVLNMAIAHSPSFTEAVFLMADWFAADGDYKSALSGLDSYAHMFPDDSAMFKTVQILENGGVDFAAQRKKVLGQLAQKYSDLGYGNLQARERLVQILKKDAQNTVPDSEYFGGLLKKVLEAKLRRL